MIYRSYRFRIYPTKSQEEILKKTIGCCRYIYNWNLELRKESYKKDKTKVSYKKSSALMTQLRKTSGTEWLKDVSFAALQQSLLNVNTAYSRFFNGITRYPKFKKRKNGGSAKFVGSSFSLGLKGFRVNRVKDSIKVVWSRKMVSKPKSCVISLNPSGQWFVSFACEDDVPHLPKINARIGIDLGIETFATLSDGTKVKQPDSIRGLRRKLARTSRSHSRKKLGSRNRDKSRVKVAHIHQRITNIRNDFQQKLSTSIVRENQVIAIEDLAVKNMAKNRKLSRCISEQGWREFRTMLDYKANWYGRGLIVIDRFTPTSQICNACGKTNKLSLDKRIVMCECGVMYDRDVNAAQNILAVGTTVSACGAGIRPISNRRLAAKQEMA